MKRLPPRLPMQLVLSLPGLLVSPHGRVPDAPCLARLLALAGVPAREPDGLDAALAARYGIARPEGGDVPLAAIRLAALGGDPGASWWLAADPVALEAGRDDVRLVGTVRDLADDEARALVASLHAHFAGDGLEFVAARPDAWFVRAAAPAALATRPLAAVAGRMLRELLPSGPDARTWRRRQDEAGMLLFAHPVNAARERAGKAPVNGVWFGEGGALPPREAAAAPIATFASAGIAVALALHAGTPARAVPRSLDDALAQAGGARIVVVALDPPPDVATVERGWAAPAWAALARGTLGTVTILADGAEGAVAWAAHRPGLARRIAFALAQPDLASLLGAARDDA